MYIPIPSLDLEQEIVQQNYFRKYSLALVSIFLLVSFCFLNSTYVGVDMESWFRKS